MKNTKIQRGLERDARLVKERFPEQLTDKEIKRVKASLKAFMAEHGLTQAKVARRLGICSSTINQFLGRGYKGNLRKLINQIVNLINSVDRRDRGNKYISFVQTTVAKRIGTLITQAEAFSVDEGTIGLIIGDGGHGKSICMRQYARANKNTIYVVLDNTMSSTSIFAEIARRIKVSAIGNMAIVARRIVGALECRNLIIMLDEASSLTVKQLNQLRQIIVVKSRCPLILAGNSDLLKTVMQRTTRRGYESLDQFTSRLIAVLNLDELASDKDGPLYTAEDIRKLYEYGGIRLTSDAVSTLKRICKTPKSGRMRTCSHIIAALHTAEAVDEESYIDKTMILSAIEQLQLTVKSWLPLAIAENVSESDSGKKVVAQVS